MISLMTLLDSDNNHVFERFVPDETPIRLKRLGRHRNWRLSFTGTGSVDYAALGIRYNTLERNKLNGTKI